MKIINTDNTHIPELPYPLHVKEYTLSNGLSVWLNVDHSQPKVFGAIVVKAGAKDTPNTGIAHYFEHIMFKGTDKIGTVNYEEEKKWLDEISNQYDELSATHDTKKRSAILKKINELSQQAAQYVIPNEFNRLISRYGGANLNAVTSYDYTVYYNTFAPQYIAQWAELNSERLLHPVFRMFQTELETVYEEKNMYGDVIGRDAMEHLLERFFYPHPYAYPIIGSTENLKNPRVSEMRKFFESYYVASNMGLILSGDFDEETTLPVLESAFSRVREGQAPKAKTSKIQPFRGREFFQVRFPTPIVAAAGYAFRGIPANHHDQAALSIAMSLLNNSNGTGFFDRLTVNRKVMAAMTMNESFNDAGFIGMIAIPKLVFQSVESASSLIWAEVERIKAGEFSQELFNSLKLEQKRKQETKLEDITSRAELMVTLFSQGKSWSDYMSDLDAIDSLTKDNIVAVARKYFTDDHLYVTKKTGKYPKDNLDKPNLTPVLPHNVDASSTYASKLASLPVKTSRPRFLDFKNDVVIRQLSPLVNLYASVNTVNDIFSLSVTFRTGRLERPALTLLSAYLSWLGADEMPFEEFRGKLQTLGSVISFDTTDNTFSIKISGFDANFSETVSLVSDFMQNVVPEDKKMKQLVDEEKVLIRAFNNSTEEMANALFEKIKYGEQSTYLTKPSLQMLKKMKGIDLVNLFRETQKVECDMYYCGALPVDSVAGTLAKRLPVEEVTEKAVFPYYRPLSVYDAPLVYFCEAPDASQSIVHAYIKGEPMKTEKARETARLFTGYFGGDMSSILFQEIREFRSYAYRISGRYTIVPMLWKDSPGELSVVLSTQNDKTAEAIASLDSIIRDLPVRPERLPFVKQSIINSMIDEYPTFRNIPARIARLINLGYTSDPNRNLLESLNNFTMDDLVNFHEKNIKWRPIVYTVTGNSKKINLNKLASFGQVIKVKKEELYS